MQNYLLRHRFFDELQKSIKLDPPARSHIEYLHNLGIEFEDRLKQEYAKKADPWIVAQSERQLAELIEKMDMYARFDAVRRNQIIHNSMLRKKEQGISRLPEEESHEMDRLENRLSLWSEFVGNTEFLHQKIRDIIPRKVENIELAIIAGVQDYLNEPVTRKNQREILDRFGYVGPGTKLYQTYTTWIKEKSLSGNIKNKLRYYEKIISELEKMGYEHEALQASKDFEELKKRNSNRLP